MIFRLVSAKSKIELKFESNLFFFKSLISVFQYDILIFEICISLYLFKKEFFTHARVSRLEPNIANNLFSHFFFFLSFFRAAKELKKTTKATTKPKAAAAAPKAKAAAKAQKASKPMQKAAPRVGGKR